MRGRKKLPLVVVFHGSGQTGNDNQSQLGLLPKLFVDDEIQRKFPAYVLAPQFPTRSADYCVDSNLHVLTSTPRPCLETLLQFIDSLKHNDDIDSNRIYVVGFSMGGSTVINAISARPDLFAAGISISGIPQFGHKEAFVSTPLWLIHGMEDTENPMDSDELFYKEMSDKYRIRFWKLKETTHDNVYTTQLLGETLPRWLFRQRRK